MAFDRRAVLLLVTLALLASCGEDGTPASVDGGLDGGSSIDAQTIADADGSDANGSTDAEASDASSLLDASDASATDDAGAACQAGVETPSPGGVCDGRGRIACQRWADELAPDGETAIATCLAVAGGGCARASMCDDISMPDTCKCGIGPACQPDHSCVEDGAGGYECVCARAP